MRIPFLFGAHLVALLLATFASGCAGNMFDTMELAAFQGAASSHSIDALTEFKQKYPKSKYLFQVEKRLAELIQKHPEGDSTILLKFSPAPRATAFSLTSILLKNLDDGSDISWSVPPTGWLVKGLLPGRYAVVSYDSGDYSPVTQRSTGSAGKIGKTFTVARGGEAIYLGSIYLGKTAATTPSVAIPVGVGGSTTVVTEQKVWDWKMDDTDEAKTAFARETKHPSRKFVVMPWP